jgi:hypothetical protein
MKIASYIFLSMLPLILPCLSFAQSDKDVKTKDVPSAVKEYLIKNYPDARNINYYKETENDTVFYEAVFKSKTDKYNLLFLPDGGLYEIEIERKFEELPQNVRENINKNLSTRFSKFKIHMVQQVNPHKNLRYELTLHGKKGTHSGYFEIFYDSNGNFISEEEETLKSIPSNSGF